jgi:transcriptional regulator
VLTQESSFHVSQIEHEAPNQIKNKRSTKFISKESCSKQMRFLKEGKNVETLMLTLIKLFKQKRRKGVKDHEEHEIMA